MTNAERGAILARLLLAYADLGWALPTSIEYASPAQLAASLDICERENARRGNR